MWVPHVCDMTRYGDLEQRGRYGSHMACDMTRYGDLEQRGRYGSHMYVT